MAGITELKEIKLGFSVNTQPRRQHKIDTNCGTVTVTVVGEQSDTKLFPLVTLHDFGFNHISQFRVLENCGEEAAKFFAQFVTYHIDLPGCEEGAGDLDDDYPSIDELMGIITHVRSSLNITKPMIILGVGAGANIAMRYILKHGKTMLGAIFVELTNDSETWIKWTQDRITDLVMKPSGFFAFRQKSQSELATDLLDKHFGRSSPPTPILADCRMYLMEHMLNSCNVANMTQYYQAFSRRVPITAEEHCTEYKCPVLMVSARQSWRNDASVDVRSELQACGRDVSLLEPSPCYIFPLDEAPKKVAMSMVLFIQSLGLGLAAGLPNAGSVADTYVKEDGCDPRDLIV